MDEVKNGSVCEYVDELMDVWIQVEEDRWVVVGWVTDVTMAIWMCGWKYMN
jgi:hypothetical protein